MYKHRSLCATVVGLAALVFAPGPLTAGSIVHAAREIAPAGESLDSVPEPARAAMIAGIILVLLGRRVIRRGQEVRVFLMLAASLVLASTCRESVAGQILFTASTDFTGGFNSAAPNS